MSVPLSNRPGRPSPTLASLAGLAAVGFLAVAGLWWALTLWGPLPLPEAGAWWLQPVWQMRALRLASAALVGAALGAGGVAIQGLLRNPLAEPYVLGLASGAGVGVRLALALAATGGGAAALAGRSGVPVFAFAGAALTAAAVCALARRGGGFDGFSLLLSGVILNVFNGALMMALYLAVDPFRADAFARWALGELPDAVDAVQLSVCAGMIAAGGGGLLFRAAALNALGLGDDVARSLGVPVNRVRLEVFAAVAVMTAAAVALAGPVAFLGLIVPHIGRGWVGPDHRRLLPVGAALGAALLMLADVGGRAAAPWFGLGRLPAGLLTALLGGPFFLLLLRRRGHAEAAS